MRNFNDTKLSVIADINPYAAKSLAEQMGCDATNNWEEVVTREDIEAVVVCTPPNSHAAISIAAIKRRKHVLCEKPLAMNLKEAKRMVNAARENNVVLKCGFTLRHHPGIQRAKEYVDKGMIGEISFIRSRYGICGRPDYDKDWRAKPKISGGGQLMDQGIHILDLFNWFLGNFSQVCGFLATLFWDIAPVEDNVFALLQTPKGQIASLHASWTQWKNLFSLEIFGQEGYVMVEGLGGSYGTERLVLGRRAFLEPFREEIIEFRGNDPSWHQEWEEFIKAIEEKREPLGSGQDGLEALRLVKYLYESAYKREVIKIRCRW